MGSLGPTLAAVLRGALLPGADLRQRLMGLPKSTEDEISREFRRIRETADRGLRRAALSVTAWA